MWLILFNLPLLIEVLRRFGYYEAWPLLVVDGTAVIIALRTSLRQRRGPALVLTPLFWLSSAALSVWGISTALLVHGSPTILAVGLRGMFGPWLFAMAVSGNMVRRHGSLERMAFFAQAWITVILVVAVIQLWSGAGAPVNRLVVAGDGNGAGDYTVESLGLAVDGVFRPTSIFLHTGKYGQVCFTLVLFILVCVMDGALPGKLWLAMLPVDFVALVVSGERAAILLILAIGSLLPLRRVSWWQQRRVRRLSVVGVSTGAVLAMGLFLAPEVRDLILWRVYSGIQDIPARLTDNLVVPGLAAIRRYGWVGEGAGFFTLGAQQFGGALIYEQSPEFATAEDSWIRLICEQGILGLLLFATAWTELMRVAWRSRTHPEPEIRTPAIFALLWMTSVSVWATTHDVMSNGVVMYLGSALAARAWWRGGSCARRHPQRTIWRAAAGGGRNAA